MRNSILLLAGVLAAGTPVLAQKKVPVKTTRQRFNPGELNVEFGLTIASTPTIASSGATFKPDVSHTGIGSNLLLRYIFPGYSRLRLGIRAAASSLRVKGDAQVLYYSNGLREDVVVKYANPLFQVGVQGHYELPLSAGVDFRISPFVGYGYAWSEKTDGGPNRVTAVPVGNTSGFNAGVDLTVKARVTNNLFITISSGYQRSWLRFTEGNSKAGFNIGHIPVNIGLSTRL
ncbi:MAG: hypothetical protein EOP52_00145 [Sphingobacteriales bacterium]|nr:MAG: hypothetical protein EOP52_00145 [Sphingobacteriales bacterium]